MSWVHNLRAQDPNSDIARVIAISLVFSIVAFLAVCLRFYVRFRTRRTLWLDDYAVFSSSILTLLYAGITVAQTRWGQGLSADYFPPQNIVPFSKIQYAGGPVYTLDLLGFKVALLTSYLRIGGFVDFYRKVILVAIVACVINQVTLTVIMSLVCLPVAKVWDTTIKGHCIHSVEFYYAVAGTSIGFDLIIIALPMPVLWKLQLHVKQKIVLTCLFALGLFVTVIQIIRIFSIAKLKEYTDSKNLVLWSVVEVSLGIIVACIPTYGPLFKAFASTVHSYRRHETGPSYPLGSTHLSSPRGNSRAKGSEHTIYGSEEMRNKTVVGSGKRDDIPKTSDAESEEHILSEDGPFYIHTTTEVMIERE